MQVSKALVGSQPPFKPNEPISADTFVKTLAGRPIALASAAEAACTRRHAPVMARADHDGDGMIATERELAELYGRLRMTHGEARGTKEPLTEVASALANLPMARPLISDDPFKTQTVLPKGRHRGERVDDSERRSARLLTPAEAGPYDPQPGETTVANFWHDDRFWIAHIPENAIERVVVQRVNFEAPVPAAHGQIRFTTRPDALIRLTPQRAGDQTPPTTLRDFVMSVEATGQPGFNYDLFQGLVGAFVNSYRLRSLSDVYDKAIVRDGQTIPQWPLAVTTETANAILMSALTRATERGQTEVYHTLFDNCLEDALRAIDKATGYKPFFGAYGVYPVWTRHYLAARKLLDPRHVLPNLEIELGRTPLQAGVAAALSG